MTNLHERVRDVELNQAAQHEQLQDHERVLRAVEDHLHDLVSMVHDFKQKTIVIAAILFIGTPTGDHMISSLGHLFG